MSQKLDSLFKRDTSDNGYFLNNVNHKISSVRFCSFDLVGVLAFVFGAGSHDVALVAWNGCCLACWHYRHVLSHLPPLCLMMSQQELVKTTVWKVETGWMIRSLKSSPTKL